jgi:hypothetical protein
MPLERDKSMSKKQIRLIKFISTISKRNFLCKNKLQNVKDVFLNCIVILNSKNGPNTEENKSTKNNHLKQNLDHTLISVNIINK